MMINHKTLENFLKEQRDNHNIPEYHFTNTSDVLQAAEAYSQINVYSQEEECTIVRPDYYKALYYIVLYATRNFSSDSIVTEYCQDVNERNKYYEAYNVFCTGQNYEEARCKMKELTEPYHPDPEAANLYSSILTNMKLNEEAKAFRERLLGSGDPIVNIHLWGIISLCFDKNPIALDTLRKILHPDYAHQVVGVEKSYKAENILKKWEIIIYSERIKKNPRDGYSMMQLKWLYSTGIHKNEDYAAYWLSEALEAGYPLAELYAINVIATEEQASLHVSEGNIKRGIEYAKHVSQCGIESGKEWIPILKKILKKGERMEREVHALKFEKQKQAVESEMQEYRNKLDRQESFWNYLAEGTPWTNAEDQLFAFVTKDYERFSEDYLLGAAREEREKRHLKQLINHLDNEDNFSQKTDIVNKTNFDKRETDVPVDLSKKIINNMKGEIILPPVDEEVLKDKKFEELYVQSNNMRQAAEFEEAKRTADQLLKLYPDSHMTHWIHFLATHGIVFEGCFEVFNIHNMIHNSYFNDRDYLWLLQNCSPEVWSLYDKYFRIFEKRRYEYLQLGESLKDVQMVLCYREKNDRGELTYSGKIAKLLLKELGEKVHIYSSEQPHTEFMENHQEALTYSALKQSPLLVLIADHAEDVLAPEIRNQWSRFYEWSKYAAEKKMIAVSSGNLTDFYQDIFHEVLEVSDETQTASLKQSILRILSEAVSGKIIKTTRTECTNEKLTESVMDYIKMMYPDFSLKTKSSFMKEIYTAPMYQNDDYFKTLHGNSVLNMDQCLYITFEGYMRCAVKTPKTLRISAKIFELDGTMIADFGWDMQFQTGHDRFALGWNYRDAEGVCRLHTGIYKVNLQVGNEDPMETLFQFISDEEDIIPKAHSKEKLYDKIIRDLNMTERGIEGAALREALMKRAEIYYQLQIEAHRNLGHQTDAMIEVFRKGLFRTQHQNHHNAKILPNGKVEVSSYLDNRSEPYEYPFDSEEAARDIHQMEKVIQVACLSSGLVALNQDGELLYGGRKDALKKYLSQIHHVKEIAHNYHSVYVLTEDGQVLEVDDKGTKVLISGHVRSITVTQGYLKEHCELHVICDGNEISQGNYKVHEGALYIKPIYFLGDTIEIKESGEFHVGDGDVVKRNEESSEQIGAVHLEMKGFDRFVYIKARLYNGELVDFQYTPSVYRQAY